MCLQITNIQYICMNKTYNGWYAIKPNQMTDVCDSYGAMLEIIQQCVKKWAKAHLKILSTKCVHKSYLIHLYKKDLALNNLL